MKLRCIFGFHKSDNYFRSYKIHSYVHSNCIFCGAKIKDRFLSKVRAKKLDSEAKNENNKIT